MSNIDRVVKLISPNLNYIMILGAVMIAVCGVPIRTTTIATQTIDCVVRDDTKASPIVLQSL